MYDPVPHSTSETPCASYRVLFGDVAAGDVDALTLARIEAHLGRCPDCRLALASARAYRRAMRRVAGSELASDSLRERVLDLRREVRASTKP